MKPNDSFNQGVKDALKAAQELANREGRPIRIEKGVWVNPSSASLARRSKPDTAHDPRIADRLK